MGILCIIIAFLALIGAIIIWTIKMAFWVTIVLLICSFIAFIISGFTDKDT